MREWSFQSIGGAIFIVFALAAFVDDILGYPTLRENWECSKYDDYSVCIEYSKIKESNNE